MSDKIYGAYVVAEKIIGEPFEVLGSFVPNGNSTSFLNIDKVNSDIPNENLLSLPTKVGILSLTEKVPPSMWISYLLSELADEDTQTTEETITFTLYKQLQFPALYIAIEGRPYDLILIIGGESAFFLSENSGIALTDYTVFSPNEDDVRTELVNIVATSDAIKLTINFITAYPGESVDMFDYTYLLAYKTKPSLLDMMRMYLGDIPSELIGLDNLAVLTEIGKSSDIPGIRIDKKAGIRIISTTDGSFRMTLDANALRTVFDAWESLNESVEFENNPANHHD